MQVHRPQLGNVTIGRVRNYGEAARRYHVRNQRIGEYCDRVIAFVVPDRTGGTEDRIRRAQRAGKPVELRVKGRKPKPPALGLVTGNPGKRPIKSTPRRQGQDPPVGSTSALRSATNVGSPAFAGAGS